MKDYSIDKDTLAIIPCGDKRTRIIGKNTDYIVNHSTNRVMDDGCKYYGSSFSGRQKGTLDLTGISYKAPIILQEDGNVIFFPTTSPRLKKCCWISLNNIDSYYYDFEKQISTIMFDNGAKMEFDMSYWILNNQIMKSQRLEHNLNKRKQEKNVKNHFE